jgi:hypothetical protein
MYRILTKRRGENMTQPTVTSFNQIAALLTQKYERYLPTAFDESMSLLQKVNKIIDYCNQIGASTNDLVTQWNAVMAWVMSDGLTTDVNAKLDAMVADGTFSTLFESRVYPDLTNLKSTFTGAGNPSLYYGVGDGLSHPVSEKFSTLADAQTYYGLDFKGRQICNSLTDECDLCSLRKVLATTTYNLVFIPYGFNGVINDSFAIASNKKVFAVGAYFKLTGQPSGGHFVEMNGDKTSISSPVPITDISWEGGTIDGNNISGVNGFGIEVAERVMIDNVKIINFVRDATIEGGRGVTCHPRSRSITVSNCHILNCSTGLDSSTKPDALDGYTDNGEQRTRNINFIGCLVENCSYAGLNVEQDNNPTKEDIFIQEIHVMGCQFFNCGYNWSNRGVINGNGAVNVKMVGCTVFNDNLHIIDCVIRGSFHRSKFDLTVQVQTLNSLVNATPLVPVSGTIDTGYGSHPLGTFQMNKVEIDFYWNAVNTALIMTTDQSGTSIDNMNNNVFDIRLHSQDTSFTTYAKPLVSGSTHYTNYGRFHDTFDMSVVAFPFSKIAGLTGIPNYTLTNTVIGGRNIDGSTITVGGLANVVSTLIDDLTKKGIVQH